MRNQRPGKRGKGLCVLFAGWLFLVLAGLAAPADSAWAGVSVSYLYSLATFTGVIPFNTVPVALDDSRREAYVSDMENNSVRIFNDRGMEVYTFGDNQNLGHIVDLGVQDDGSILLLSYLHTFQGAPVLIRCNYRGEPQEQMALRDLPEGFTAFRPSAMFLRGERLFLVDESGLKVVVADLEGAFVKGYDLKGMLLSAKADAEETKGAGEGLGGFFVAEDGTFYFTIPTIFSAVRVTPDGQVRGFGQPGSSPGKFGVISGITADRRGNIFVVDTLRCVVMVFDKDFSYQTEFGYRRPGPEGLVAPKGVWVSNDGKVFVNQRAGRGVNVYQATEG